MSSFLARAVAAALLLVALAGCHFPHPPPVPGPIQPPSPPNTGH